MTDKICPFLGGKFCLGHKCMMWVVVSRESCPRGIQANWDCAIANIWRKS